MKFREKLTISNETEIWMDSGGFQIGKKIHPKVSIFDVYEYQQDCADIAFTLDVPGDYRLTYENALRVLAYARGRGKGPKIYAVVTCDGNIEEAIKLAKKYNQWDFDGIAIGPPISLGAVDIKLLANLVLKVRKVTSKPIHVFGVGSYDIIYLLAALNVQSFDSAKFIHGAKWREYHLPRGSIVYLGKNYKEKRKSCTEGELPCSCPVCKRIKKIEKFQYPKAEMVAYLALHNFYVMKNEVKLIEISKKGGWFKKLLKEQARKSPRLKYVLKFIKTYSLN